MSADLEPYNPDWPCKYDAIIDTLKFHLDGVQGVEYTHIGSTCIPTLPSRPIIDILLTIPADAVDSTRHVLESAGNIASTELPKTLGFVFTPLTTNAQYTHAVYLCEADGLAARAHLAIQALLSKDAELREEYKELKSDYQTPQQLPRNDTGIQTHDQIKATPSTLETPYEQAKSTFLQQSLILSAAFTDAELPTLLQAPTPAPHRWTPLSTPRLTLRELDISDIAGMYTLESNPLNARYQSWEPWTRMQARQNVVRGIWRSYGAERDVVELAVILTENEEQGGRFVGRIGGRVHTPSPVGRDDSSPIVEKMGEEESNRVRRTRIKADLWYSLLPSVQGKGVATEAMMCFIAALTGKVKAQSADEEAVDVDVEVEFEIECDPRNTASWRVAEKLGFSRESLTERAWECKGEWVDSLVYRRIT